MAKEMQKYCGTLTVKNVQPGVGKLNRFGYTEVPLKAVAPFTNMV